MTRIILLTGASGCVGRALVSYLRARHGDVELILLGRESGDITKPRLGLSEFEAARLADQVDIIVHAAADTRFTACFETLHRTNVTGTQNLLEFARACPRLQKFVHISTTCVAGTQTGEIREELIGALGFINAYERSKAEAEILVHAADLPTQIIRLATVLGSECDGKIPRWGAAHLTLYFLYRGLIAMVPGNSGAALDFISTELAARVIATAALDPDVRFPILHASAGKDAAPLHEFLDFALERFGRRALTKPPVVDEMTFRLFQNSVRTSRDLLFNQVLGCTQSFLPGLLYPKTYSTRNSEALLGMPLPIVPWRDLAGGVIDHCLATNWKRGEPAYAYADAA